MSTLNDLGTDQLLNDGVDFNNLPEQGGGYTPPPQPGTYRFRLPATLSAANFSKRATTDFGDRLVVKFDQTAPLLIVQAPPAEADRIDTPFETQLNNAPRNRARKGQPAQYVSDMDYLNKALALTERPGTNRAYAEALLAKAAESAEFTADIAWGWNCSDKRDAYFEVEDPENPGALKNQKINLTDENGQAIPEQYRKGCGQRMYANKDVHKANVAAEGETPRMQYPMNATCKNPNCGASVRAFPNLERFQA